MKRYAKIWRLSGLARGVIFNIPNKIRLIRKAERKIMVRHIMKDGTELDSIEGHIIPMNEDTTKVYRILMDFIRMKKGEKSSEEPIAGEG